MTQDTPHGPGSRKGYTYGLHTRTSPEAQEGLQLFAGDLCLSDALDALGVAIAKDPQKADLIWALIQDSVPREEQKSFWGNLIDKVKAGAAAVGVAVGLSTAVAQPVIPVPAVTQVVTQAPAELPYPNLWNRIEQRLRDRVNEQNYEIWLSSCRASGDDGETLTLLVPNAHFEEYLADHYTEVIQEVLYSVSPRKVVFVARPQLPEPPKPPPPPKPKTPEEELKDLEVKLSAGIPLDVLENDIILHEIKYKRLEWSQFNPAAFTVSNKAIELTEQFIERLRFLRERFVRRPTGKRLPPKRNDRPWRK